MNRWQKVAWFNLMVTAAAFVICIVVTSSATLILCGREPKGETS